MKPASRQISLSLPEIGSLLPVLSFFGANCRVGPEFHPARRPQFFLRFWQFSIHGSPPASSSKGNQALRLLFL